MGRDHVYVRGKVVSYEKKGPKKKSGRGPPTSPTLRPRVLTPRDHFAHRGGGRAMIMHKSNSRCNPNLKKFFEDFSRANDNKIATLKRFFGLRNLRSRNQNNGLDTVK